MCVDLISKHGITLLILSTFLIRNVDFVEQHMSHIHALMLHNQLNTRQSIYFTRRC